MDPITDELVDQTREAYRMFRDHDPAFLDGLDPEVEYLVPDTMPGGGDIHGVWDVLAFQDSIAELFDDPRPDPEEFLPTSQKLIVLGTWRGRAKATGVSVEVPFAHVLQYRDGKLAYIRVYMDAAKVLQSLDEAAPG